MSGSAEGGPIIATGDSFVTLALHTLPRTHAFRGRLFRLSTLSRDLRLSARPIEYRDSIPARQTTLCRT